jgi:hypothetical protein
MSVTCEKFNTKASNYVDSFLIKTINFDVFFDMTELFSKIIFKAT